MSLYKIIFNISLLIFISLLYSEATLSKNDRKKTTKPLPEAQKGPTDQSVSSRNLVTVDVKPQDIHQWCKTYHKDKSKKSDAEIVLGYVTPWNNHGYNIAKVFGGKFTHISPVWLQLKVDAKSTYSITGGHDIDSRWVKEVRKAGKASNVKIVPRLIFENWQAKHFKELIIDDHQQEVLANYLIEVLENYKLDGFVVEVWSQAPSMEVLKALPDFIARLGRRIRSKGFSFILVIPPSLYKHNRPGYFSMKEFEVLVDDVDAFSLMTYDYSSFQDPGPNSPINWMKKCVENLVPDASSPNRKKILLGLNMYGLDHSVTGGKHIIGKDYAETVSAYQPNIQFDSVSVEHFFEYKSSGGVRRIFYPTLHSLNERIKLAKDLNTGLSLWELGQGLDYFYDLF